VAQAPEKEGLAPPTEAGLQAALAAAESVAVAPWHDALAGRALLERPPAPGPVRSRRTVAAAGVTVLELANGVRIWLKPTDFKKDEVLFAAQAPGGYSIAAPERYQALAYTAEIVSEAGAGGFTPVDLQKLLAGKLAGARVTIDDFSQGISGSSAPQDLETALQLVHLWFTSPNDRPAALEIIRKRLRTNLANRARDPDAAFSDRVAAVNASDHYMERPITLAEVEALDFAPVLDFYRARFANAADFTFFFVGAFDPAALEPLLERYLGSLPSGGARRSRAVERPYRFPAATTSVDVRSGSEPKSRTALAFFADARGDRDQLFRLNAACELLEIRLRDRLREDLGSTYSVSVGYADAWPMRGYGRVGVWFGGAPESRDRMEAAALQVVRKVCDEGPTAGEVGRVQEILRRELELDEKRNAWWLGVLQTCEARGWKLQGGEERRRRIEALTASSLRDACRRYLPLDRWTRVSLLPESAPAAADSSAAPGGSSGR
jgi:zinc protease